MRKHLAIVEDERLLAENYRDALQRQGFDVTIHHDLASAQKAFAAALPDLAIIDIGLGDDVEGGFELCRSLRAASASLPIVFLTARDSELDMISGLRLGADDYLTKDISQAHMLARITALLRRVDALRTPVQQDNSCIQHGSLQLDLDRLHCRWQSQLVQLTVTEFWMVHALAAHPGHLKTRQQLMDAANVVLDDNTITSHIKRIRRKFQQCDAQFNAVETVYGMGYRWLCD
jgi:two-component system OmpR family response regulator